MGLFGALGGTPLTLEPGETVVREGPANLFRGFESVGGQLWLTDRRLVFRSHAIAVQSGESAWPLAEIARVEPWRTFRIVPNGVRAHLRSGQVLQFVVQGRAAWVEALAARLAPVSSGAPSA